MKSKIIKYLFTLFLVNGLQLSGTCQNLVPDPSIEDYYLCSSSFGWLDFWFETPFYWNSPEYFNSCDNSSYGGFNNAFGNQTPRTGDGYAGVFAYQDPFTNAREYISIQLTSPLVVGTKYCIQYYISLAEQSEFSINSMGAVVRDTNTILFYYASGGNMLMYSPQVENSNNQFDDYTGWTPIYGSFTADAPNLKYLTIGCFEADDSLNIISSGLTGQTAAYYYLDDVSVTEYVAPTDTISICENDSINLYGYYVSSLGAFYDTLNNPNGCKNVVGTVVDSILPISLTTFNVSTCSNDSIMLANEYYNSDTIVYETFIAANGCDSIFKYIIETLPIFNNIDTIYTCPNDSALIFGNWQTIPNVYSDYYTSVIGCDSIINIELVEAPIYSVYDTLSICDYDSVLLGGSFQNSMGSYIDTLITSLGCDSILITNLVIINSPIADIVSDSIISIGESTELTACCGDSYIWNSSELLECTTCETTISTPLITSEYFLSVEQDGCSNSDTITVYVDDNFSAVFPNVFSPNFDGKNDFFRVNGIGIQSLNIEIRNRWGQIIYEFNGKNVYWDGRTIEGGDSPEGVYYYTAIIGYYKNQKITNKYYQGYFSLFR